MIVKIIFLLNIVDNNNTSVFHIAKNNGTLNF